MVEYLWKGDPRILFLKPREVVYFTPRWDRVGGKYFQIEVTQQIKRDFHKIIGTGKTLDQELSDDAGFLPTNLQTLYEVNVVMKGNLILYPLWPSTDYYLKKEKAGYAPAPGDDDLRYIGNFDSQDIPWTMDGGVLKLYLVKDMPTILLRWYNDSIGDERLVIRFWENRCKLKEVKEAPVYRTIFHYKDMIW